MQRVTSKFAVIAFALSISPGTYANSYCELEGATTDSGEEVTGECYRNPGQTGISLQKPPSATIFEQLSWPLNLRSDTDFTTVDAVA